MVIRKIFDNARFRLYCWLFCIVIVLSVACLLSWLSLTPKNPRFQISDTRLLGFDPYINQSTHGTDKYLMFNLEILNPNKRMGIFYSGITLNLYEGCCVVGTNTTPSFYQGYKNTTSFDILIHAGTRQGSKAQTTDGGNIDYRVGVQTHVRFRIMRWKTKLRQIEYKSTFHAAGEVQAPSPTGGVEIKASPNLTF